jgi:hypothetical protein
MPAVLTVQRVEHRVFDHGEVVVALQCTFELRLEQSVQGGECAPALRPDLDGIIGDCH